jgi:hypothetical protein
MSRSFRFSLCHREVQDPREWRDFIRKAGDHGYSTLLFLPLRNGTSLVVDGG